MYTAAIIAALMLGAPDQTATPPPVLTRVADIALPGAATRFDYQSLDRNAHRLYIAHMGDSELLVFDTAARTVVARLCGFPTVTGVLVIPELHRVFASVVGRREVAVVDTQTLKTLAHVPAGAFPDGLAWAAGARKVYVSDESGGQETVIDANTNRRVATIDVGGEAGNTQFDPVSQRILVNVQSRNQVVVIDPTTDTVVARHALANGTSPHGLLVLAPERLAFVACEDDSKLLVLDLETWEVRQTLATGHGPDVLAFDAGLAHLYAATESGVVSVFQLTGRTLEKLEDVHVGADAHSVCADPATHEVFMPLKNVDGRPMLRIMQAHPETN